MNCPQCGAPVLGNFCSECGCKIEGDGVAGDNFSGSFGSVSPNTIKGQDDRYSSLNQSQCGYQQHRPPSSEGNMNPSWPEDLSVWSLILTVGGIILFFFSGGGSIFGLIAALISIILGGIAKKQNGRFSRWARTLSSIAFAGEILLGIYIFSLFSNGAI